jgi:hypothetical protein
LWVVGIQYFLVGLFDFHRALERRTDYWMLESFPFRMAGCRLCCFVDLGMAAEQLHAPLAR